MADGLVPSKKFGLRDVVEDSRVVLMLALGFACGLPILLVFSTLSAWLATAGIQRTSIGLLSYVSFAYSLKFLWAPVIDRLDLPILARWLGRRRAWMVLAQLVVAAGLVGMSHGRAEPGTRPSSSSAPSSRPSPRRRRTSSSTAGASMPRPPSARA